MSSILRLRAMPFIFYLLSAPAMAQEFYQGIRQMGMGGAAIAVVNDETSLLLNPNGLARLRETYVTVVDAEVTGTTDHISTVSDLLLDAVKPNKIYTELVNQQDETYFAKAQTFPSIAIRGFGVGFLANYNMQARRLSSNQSLELNYVSDWAAVVGYNYSLSGGVVKLGVSGRLIDRLEYVGTVDPNTQSLEADNLTSEGVALAGDAAISFTSPTKYLPTLTVMAKDIGDTSFGFMEGFRDQPDSPVPRSVPFSIDAALAFFPIWSRNTRGTFTVELDDLSKEGRFEDVERRLHVGAEVNFHDKFFFRAGYNRGYVTGGFEWATTFSQIQLAYYGEEIGTDANPIQQDRYSMKFIFRF